MEDKNNLPGLLSIGFRMYFYYAECVVRNATNPEQFVKYDGARYRTRKEISINYLAVYIKETGARLKCIAKGKYKSYLIINHIKNK